MGRSLRQYARPHGAAIGGGPTSAGPLLTTGQVRGNPGIIGGCPTRIRDEARQPLHHSPIRDR
jgi:hypothetical protein